MKKFLKILGIGTLVVGLGLVIMGWAISEPIPNGESGPKADALAKKMLATLNEEAFKKTKYLKWSFQNGKHHYVWNKHSGTVRIRWQNYEVFLNIESPEQSKAKKDGVLLSGDKAKDLVRKSWDMFNNDSFWLIAPYKIFDHGTKRSIVILENGNRALLVTYTTGGTTPGDSYLWLLNENGFPNAFKMWVQVIPIGGIKSTWDDWIIVESGAFLPKSHQLGPLTLDMGDVKGYP